MTSNSTKLAASITTDTAVASAYLNSSSRFTTTRTIGGLTFDQDHKSAVSSPGYIGKVLVFRSEQGGEKRLALKLEPIRAPL